ncbi:MAG: tRNA uridine-5-carboxymethylaminomethyl(34) synthesis GTPase MnmE [Acidobacteria bacterium]|nr:tRNA uridine-5-carboxymethylaminomethyl(34) synthesis GTPase MnmE [Acidobacteriota bacterium]
MTESTVVALATPLPQPSALAIIRVSGPLTEALVARFFVPKNPGPLKPWRLRRGNWHDVEGLVDDITLVFYRAPQSYTGEDMCEIFCHGNPVFCDQIIGNLVDAGAERAQPGEFTRRALLEGRMGLLEAEALHELVTAKTRFQADLIRQQHSSPLVKALQQHVQTILGIQAHIEATIDYGEEDIDALQRPLMLQQLSSMLDDLKQLKKTASFALGMKRGFRVLLAGAPNVGKSTLFNALLDRERAIVSEWPGTTRDYLAEEVEINGLPVVLIDTAGLRETEDMIEAEGIRRVTHLFGEVDLVLVLVDPEHGIPSLPPPEVLPSERLLIVANKSDVSQATGADLAISARDGRGLSQLEAQIVLRLSSAVTGQSAYLINQRQEDVVAQAITLLQHAIQDTSDGHGEEILSSYLNQLRQQLGELTGETTVEDLLDRMFASFCLGK